MTEQPQNLYITPEQADLIVNRAVVDMLHNGVGTYDVDAIRVLCDHLRAALAPLVKAETEDQT